MLYAGGRGYSSTANQYVSVLGTSFCPFSPFCSFSDVDVGRCNIVQFKLAAVLGSSRSYLMWNHFSTVMIVLGELGELGEPEKLERRDYLAPRQLKTLWILKRIMGPELCLAEQP